MKDPSAALWLYGSAARGDADSESDLDVLVVADSTVDRSEVLAITNAGPDRLALTQYSWKEIENIACYGSLFLHHIGREARCLVEGPTVEGRLRRILDSLGTYRRPVSDLAAFRAAVADARESLAGGGSVAFELSVLGTVFRHAAILGCYLSGVPTFGRLLPVHRLVEMWNLDSDIGLSFETLYRYRLWAVRHGPPPPQVALHDAYTYCDRAEEVLSKLGEHVDAYETRLRETDRSSKKCDRRNGIRLSGADASQKTRPFLREGDS